MKIANLSDDSKMEKYEHGTKYGGLEYLLGEEDPTQFWPEHALRGEVP